MFPTLSRTQRLIAPLLPASSKMERSATSFVPFLLWELVVIFANRILSVGPVSYRQRANVTEKSPRRERSHV